MTIESQTETKQDEIPVGAAEVQASVADDDMQKPIYNKIQLGDIIAREKQKHFERGKREALMELQQQQAQQAEQQPTAQQAPSSLGGMQQLSQADIERLIAEKAPQLLQDHVNQLQTAQTIESFVSKMQAAEQRHPGLEAKLNDLDYSTLAPVIKLANNMENTADIMKELVDNPMKMGNLTTLMYTQPKLAERAMQELSNSIKQNQEAQAQADSARDPMAQLKPSANAGMDKGDMSVKDFQKMFRA